MSGQLPPIPSASQEPRVPSAPGAQFHKPIPASPTNTDILPNITFPDWFTVPSGLSQQLPDLLTRLAITNMPVNPQSEGTQS